MTIIGFINIFKTDNFLNVNGGLYEKEETAIKTGKCVKGYLATINISVTIPEEVSE